MRDVDVVDQFAFMLRFPDTHSIRHVCLLLQCMGECVLTSTDIGVNLYVVTIAIGGRCLEDQIRERHRLANPVLQLDKMVCAQCEMAPKARG